MKLLLDTHTVLWWFFNDNKLSVKAREVIPEPANDCLVSSASAWEIATKHRIGRLPEAGDIVANLPAYLREARFSILEISLDHALLAGTLSGPHKDPFDRMLIAQAKIEKLLVVTVDPVFQLYGLSVIW